MLPSLALEPAPEDLESSGVAASHSYETSYRVLSLRILACVLCVTVAVQYLHITDQYRNVLPTDESANFNDFQLPWNIILETLS
jgi:uncharacterized membrane protein